MMARFARLSIGAGRMLDVPALSPEVRKGAEDGMADAWRALAAVKEQVETPARSPAATCSARAKSLKNNYLYRMFGAVAGIYGNSKEEAIYDLYTVDAAGQPLDARGPSLHASLRARGSCRR